MDELIASERYFDTNLETEALRSMQLAAEMVHRAQIFLSVT